jgi:type II secretory pathway pseudopilin PulG
MKKSHRQIEYKRAFTLLELLITSGILVLILSTLVPLSMSIYRDYIIGQALSQFEIESSTTREWLKRDLACTSANEFQLYPENESTHLLAVGFPILSRDGSTSSLPMDADGNIEWTHTVVYHLFTTDDGEIELRRTAFTPRMDLTTTERQTQLEEVQLYGNGDSTYNAINATTQILLSDIIEHNITSGTGEIDTYGPSRENQLFSFGTWVISPGYHTYKFEISGRNDSSSGYSFALDRINVSATGDSIDAECLMPVNAQIGAIATKQDMSLYTGWSNNSQLNFPGSSIGSYVKLQIYNDCWVESTFSNDDATIDETEVGFDFDIDEVVCQLKGVIATWEAVSQTEDTTPSVPDTGVNYSGYDVRVIISGADLTLGENITYGRPRCYVTFRAAPTSTTSSYCHIKAAYIMEQDSGYNGVPGTEVALEFPTGWNIDYDRDIYAYGIDNATGTPDSMWVLTGYTGVSEWANFNIDPTKNYIVSFHLGYVSKNWDETAGKYEYYYYYYDPAVWTDVDGDTNSYAYHNPAPATSVAGTADWSSIDPALIEEKDRVLAVDNITVSYPTTGTYTSKIQDTRLASPEYVALNWRENVSGSDDITIRVRAGDAEDLSDAVVWSAATTLTSPTGVNSISGLSGRYVQWQATMESASPYTSTPKLRDVILRWKGEERGMQITVNADQGPSRGKVTLSLDGEEPQPSQLKMEFTTGKTIRGIDYSKEISVGITPKN